MNVTVLRNGGKKQFEVRLANQFGKETIGKLDFTKYLIGDLKKISNEDATKYRVNYGVEIYKLRNRSLIENEVKNGDIILRIGKEKVYDVDGIEKILRQNKGKNVILQILNQEGVVEYLSLVVNN